MQDTFSPLFQLKTHNRYPDCLKMELTTHPLESDSPNHCLVELYLTLEFGEQWEPILGGRVKWGLKGGQLRLQLGSGMRLVGEPDSILSETSSAEIPALRVTTNSSSATEWLWQFAVEPSAPSLKGALAKVKLATLELAAQPENLEASFVADWADLSVTDAEDLWKHDISPNKHAILERQLARSLWEHRLMPYLSLTQLSFHPETSAKADESNEEEAAVARALQQVIDHISAANTDNFLELAAIAKLDPARDFVGGNLLGATLSSLDLSSVNFARINLRGADLSDADLSETNLSGANLRGADLSGAYLGNANLRNADLQRASLALANLGGADASGANLQEVNLSSTNLASVKVEGATFAQNPGLAEEVKLNLQQRGAIVREG